MNTPNPPKKGHLVVVPFEAWGHVRPLLYTSLQLLALHPSLHITVLLSPTGVPRVERELASSNLAHLRRPSNSAESSVLSRLQVIPVQMVDEPPTADLVQSMTARAARYADAIAKYFGVLFAGARFIGAAVGAVGMVNRFSDIPPSCVVFDMFQGFVPFVVQQVITSSNGSIKPIPMFTFTPTGPTAVIHAYAKEEDGGLLVPMKRIVKQGVEQGLNPLEAIAPLGIGDRGVLKSLPGLPTMTDYELHPGVGACPVPPPLILSLFKSFEAVWSPAVTGFIAPSVEEMEPEGKRWIEEKMGKPFLSLGFQYTDDVWKGEVPPPAAEDADGIAAMAFLDKMLQLRGPRSVIYISYGSTFFPVARPDLVHHILDTLLSTSTPCLFSHATELFPVPHDLLEKIKTAEFGLAVHVAPQVPVLNHAATGFFLGHCGGNSMAEAIVAGVPIVGMPFAADQGEQMMILKRFGAGIDLKQVKCFFGQGEMPNMLYDGTVLVGTEEAIKAEMVDLWAQLKGELGEKLYKGMGELHQMCKKSCSQGGASRQAMLDFAKYF